VKLGAPDGYEFDEGEYRMDPNYGAGELPDEPVDPTKSVFGEWDTPCTLETWETEAVFLSRERGEAYGRATAPNHRDGWRVYCVPARGALAHLLAKHGEEYWPEKTT